MRGSAWQGRLATALAAVATLQVAGYAVSLAVRPTGTEVVWADVLFGQLIWFVAGAAAIAKSTLGRAYRAWAYIGTASVAYGLGWLLYTFWAARLEPEPAFSVADVLWFAVYPLALAGLALLIYRRIAHDGLDFWLDMVLAVFAALAVFATIFALVVEPVVTGDDAAWASVMVIYLVFDVIMIVLGILMMHAYVWRAPRGLLVTVLAFVLLGVTDWWYLVLLSTDRYVSFSLIDLGWPAVAALLAWGAALDSDQTSRRVEVGRITTVIPGLSVLIAAAVIVVAAVERLAVYVTVFAVAAILIATVRLIRAIAEASDATTQARLARTDHLTGLANRRALYEAMEQLQSEQRQPGGTVAVILLDLDGFKDVNDTLGHEAGDQALSIVSQRLAHHVREPDVLARLGGDEFAVLLTAATTDDANAVAERLRDSLRPPIALRGREFQLSASIGIAVSAASDDARAVLTHADAAMYESKGRGRDAVTVYLHERPDARPAAD